MAEGTVVDRRSVDGLDVEHTVDVEGIRLRVHERGPAEPDTPQQPVVLQHGLGGSAVAVCADYAPPGRRVLAMDARGHGGSDLGSPSALGYAALAADLDRVLDRLDVPAAPVVGVSMGAGVAVALALANPARVRALVLIRPVWSPAGAGHLDPLREVAELLRRHGREEGAARFRAGPTYAALAAVAPGSAQAILDQFAEPRAISALPRLERMVADRPWRDPSELASVTVPALVVGNPDDPIHPLPCARWLADRLPAASLTVVPGRYTERAAHVAQTRSATADFLRSLETAPW